MKILVTGGSGFIGSAYIRNVIRATKHDVVNIDALTYAATPDALEDAQLSDRYQFEQIDIRDGAAVANVINAHKPDAIVHLAAESHVDRSIDGPAVFMETNIMGTYNLLAAAKDYWQGMDADAAAHFRFHHVSTDEVYGTLHPNDPAFHEETPYAPNSPYSASKASSDHLVRAWGETYGLPILVTNCSNNYGPWQYPEKLIPLMFSKGLAGQEMPVYGTGENIRDWLYVDDHARALLVVLEKGKLGETYNIGGNEEHQNLDIVHRICAFLDENGSNDLDHKSLIKFVTDRPGHDFRYAINANKIETELGWSPQETFTSGLGKTLSWYMDNQDWWKSILEQNSANTRRGLKGSAE